MNHIDLKYCGYLSTRVDRYQVKAISPYRANLRCPICGDSQKSKKKARGWILEKDNSAIYYCHNCGISTSFGKFLKMVDSNLYNDYVVDVGLEKHVFQRPVTKENNFLPVEKPVGLDKLLVPVEPHKKDDSPLLRIKKVSSLAYDHPVKEYIVKRKIPTNKHFKLYYAPKFNAWVNTIIPDKLPTEHDEPRLVIPFIDASGNMFGFAGRSFSKNSLRYITIMIDSNYPKIFGLDDIDFMKKYYVVEGQIDSLFLPNCLAMAGADGNTSGLSMLENAVFVFDNEPRNKEIVARMQKAIDKNLKVCIWPSNLTQKDINDMILAGYKDADVKLIIDSNTYSGLEAKLALMMWKRC